MQAVGASRIAASLVAQPCGVYHEGTTASAPPARIAAARLCIHLALIVPANEWATILPFCTTKVSVPISYTLSAVSALQRMKA